MSSLFPKYTHTQTFVWVCILVTCLWLSDLYINLNSAQKPGQIISETLPKEKKKINQTDLSTKDNVIWKHYIKE